MCCVKYDALSTSNSHSSLYVFTRWSWKDGFMIWVDFVGPKDRSIWILQSFLTQMLNVGEKIIANFVLDVMSWVWGLDLQSKTLSWYLLQERKDEWNRIPALRELVVFSVHWSWNQESGTLHGKQRKESFRVFHLTAEVICCGLSLFVRCFLTVVLWCAFKIKLIIILIII